MQNKQWLWTYNLYCSLTGFPLPGLHFRVDSCYVQLCMQCAREVWHSDAYLLQPVPIKWEAITSNVELRVVHFHTQITCKKAMWWKVRWSAHMGSLEESGINV